MKKGTKIYQSVVWSTTEGVGNTRVNIGQEKLSLLKTADGNQGVSVHDLRTDQYCQHDLRRTV